MSRGSWGSCGVGGEAGKGVQGPRQGDFSLSVGQDV